MIYTVKHPGVRRANLRCVRLLLTEPCQYPTPMSPARAWSAMPPSSRPTATRSPCGGVPTTGWGFAYQVAFVRVLGRFPRQAPLEIDGEILRFAALQLNADAETIHAYARRQQTVSAHQRRIGQYLRLRTFDTATGERLARFLEDEALRLDRTGSLLARARSWLRDEHVLAPADSALRRAVGGARQKARALLTRRMTERLSASMRDRLDALVAVGDDDPHSPLHRIKTGSSSPSVGGMKRLLARLELIEATGVLEVDVGWVNGNYQRILFHTVRTASADRVREMAAPRRHLALVCFLHQAWRDTLDQAVDMYGKLLDRNRKLVEGRLDDMLKAQRQAVDRIVHRYRQLGAVLLDPDVGDDELRARLLSTVPEAQLREDQSDLANGTRGDRKARFERTAERHAGLSRFAGPFLSRMKFVDEQGEGASPTLSALRAYREHRAAGAPRRPARCAARLRADGAAAAHPPGRRDGPPPLGERVVPQGARRDPDRQPGHRRREELRPVRGVLPARRAVGAGPRSVLGANRVPRRPRRAGGQADDGRRVNDGEGPWTLPSPWTR